MRWNLPGLAKIGVTFADPAQNPRDLAPPAAPSPVAERLNF
jgi:hypothetical protein